MTGPKAKPCWMCGATPARLYLRGWLCALHAPPAGPTPDPALTADGLRRSYLDRIRPESPPAPKPSRDPVVGFLCGRSGRGRGCHPIRASELVSPRQLALL